MKILIVTHIYPSKKNLIKGIYIETLVEQIRKTGHEVVICATRSILLLPLLLPLKLVYFILSIKPDIIHAHFGAPTGFITTLLCKKIPVVVTMHRAELFHFLLKPLIPYTTKHAKSVICVSEDVKNKVLHLCHNKYQQNLKVIHNAVDTEIYRTVDDNHFRKKHRIPPEAILISAVGMFEPRKNFELLIKAFGQLPKELNGFLAIAGTGKRFIQCQKLIEDSHLSDRVALVGLVHGYEKICFLSESEIFALPSSSEGHSIALLEAMACENAIVSSDIPNCVESIDSGIEGYTVPIERDAISEKLEKLLKEAVLRKKMGKSARAKVETRFSWHARVKKILETYQEVLDA